MNSQFRDGKGQSEKSGTVGNYAALHHQHADRRVWCPSIQLFVAFPKNVKTKKLKCIIYIIKCTKREAPLAGMKFESFHELVLVIGLELTGSELSVQEPVHAMEPLESGHRKPEAEAANVRSAIAKATALLGYKLNKEQEKNVFQSASGKQMYLCVCLLVLIAWIQFVGV